ncbi:MAG: saccharopine dehydrogenase [Saprospirales bacterium]|nr:MAG: saccharopine dehydrogenase [Saprospirales bacterium]
MKSTKVEDRDKLLILPPNVNYNCMDSRELDLIVFGATGFTGKLVVEYLHLKRNENSIKWGMAGRDIEKLNTLKESIGCDYAPAFVADSNHLDSLIQMTKKAKVVASTVGPYARYGSLLVEACVTTGTDYCDLSGEVHWMRKMIDRWQEKAIENKVRLVHCCGFDSIPSDMGVLWMQDRALKKTGSYFPHISMQLLKISGGFSGGTFESMFNIRAEAEKDKSIYKVIMRPYSLNPDPEFRGPDSRDLKGVKWDPFSRGYVAPFIMATINTRVVRRSHALQNFQYGDAFTYEESIYCGRGWKGKLNGWKILLPLAVVRLAKPGTWLYKLVRSFLPKPGQGPSKEKIENGFYHLRFWGKSADGKVYAALLNGKRDPGYGATSRMLAESAIRLAESYDKSNKSGGFLTPATAFGLEFIEVLQEKVGMVFIWDNE